MQDISNKKEKKSFTKTTLGIKLKYFGKAIMKKGMMYGFSDNYIRVGRKFDEKYINTITQETLEHLNTINQSFEIKD